MSTSLQLYKYQKEDIIRIEDLDGRVLNASEMGTGKTIETLMALKRNPEWLPALVVCPASLKYNWAHEARVYVDLQVSICETRTPPVLDRNDFSMLSPILIINYDILKDWLPYLRKFGIKTLVCDESQFLTNPNTQRTRAVRNVAKRVQQMMFLSGTPLTNRPVEMYPALNMLWPTEFPSAHEYYHRYCNPKYRPWGWDYRGSSNLDELHTRLIKLGMIRRRIADVVHDLPEKVRRIVPCEMADPAEYIEASGNFAEWMRRVNPTRARSALKNEALVKVGYLLRLISRLKMRSVVEWVNKFLDETEQKIVLFAHHVKAIEVLKRRIKSKMVVVDGSVTGRLRQAAVDQFQKDKKTRVFIGSEAARVGLTLTAASTVGFVEMCWWRPGDYAQAERRIYRIGQKNHCFFQYFAVPGTIEEKLCQILQEKQEVITAVLDGDAYDGEDDLNVFDLLLAEIDRGLQ